MHSRQFLLLSTLLILLAGLYPLLHTMLFWELIPDFNQFSVISFWFLFTIIILAIQKSIPKIIVELFLFSSIMALIYLEFIGGKFYDTTLRLIEHSLKLGIPSLLLLLIFKPTLNETVIKKWLKRFLALTFIGHGIYASGLVVEPSSFQFILKENLSNSIASHPLTLQLISLLDISAGLYLLLFKTKEKIILRYMLGWTIMAIAARIIAYFPKDFVRDYNYLAEISWRLIYIITPIFLLTQCKKESKKKYRFTRLLALKSFTKTMYLIT